jgi:hypothetical protein
MGLVHQGMPGLACALLRGRPPPGPVEQTRAAIGTSASITWLMQDAQGESTREGCPPPLTAVGALDRTGRNRAAVVGEIPHHPARGADVAAGVEQPLDRFLHVRSRIARPLAGWRLDAADRPLRGACPPGGLMA